MDYYEPEDDSKLLLKNTKKELKKLNSNTIKFCEVGVGSGYVITNIAKQFTHFNYFGSDINKKAIQKTNDEFKNLNQKINLKNKSLLTGFKEKFEIIIFNTPYLPCEENELYEELEIIDKAIYGGKHGYEIIEKFIYEINDKLEENGFVIMAFSSLSHLSYIEDILKKNLFDFEILDKKSVFFEELIIIKLWKSNILKMISRYNIQDIKYLSHGKHSIVLDGKLRNKKVVIKCGKEKDISIENLFLKKLQKEKFVPKLYFEENNFQIREKITGTLIGDFFKSAKKEDLIIVIDKVLQITQNLDLLGINKSEMTNPYKHIYILDNLEVKMIDYERCIFTRKPKNTTQFFQYLRRYFNCFKKKGLEFDDQKIFEISKKYKEENFKFNINNFLK